MIRLKKGNIERIVDSQEKGDEYIAKGFILLEQAGQATLDTRKKQLSEMTVEEMMAYAAENGIDIGKASSAEGILKKNHRSITGSNWR